MSDFKIYDLDNCTFAFLGVPLSGYGEGGAVKVEKADPNFVTKVGMDGNVVRTKKGSKLYKITLTLMQGATANAILAAIMTTDANAQNGAGVGPLVFSDNGGTSKGVWGQAWIEGPPSSEFANEAKDREWIFAGVG